MFLEAAKVTKRGALRSVHVFCSGYIYLRRLPDTQRDTWQRQEPSEPGVQREGLTSGGILGV